MGDKSGNTQLSLKIFLNYIYYLKKITETLVDYISNTAFYNIQI